MRVNWLILVPWGLAFDMYERGEEYSLLMYWKCTQPKYEYTTTLAYSTDRGFRYNHFVFVEMVFNRIL